MVGRNESLAFVDMMKRRHMGCRIAVELILQKEAELRRHAMWPYCRGEESQETILIPNLTALDLELVGSLQLEDIDNDKQLETSSVRNSSN